MVCAPRGAALGCDLEAPPCQRPQPGSNSFAAKWLFKSPRPGTVTSPCAARAGHDTIERPRVGLSPLIPGALTGRADERALPGGADVRPLRSPRYCCAAGFRGARSRNSFAMAQPGTLGSDHQAPCSRIRPGQRTRGRATHRAGPSGRDRPSRRDPLVFTGRPAVDVGGR